MSGHVDSSPHLFRPVTRALLTCTIVLLVGAMLVPAPLEAPGDPARAPNPAKSAWFLLWLQELVSHGTTAIYLAVALAVLLVALPWLPLAGPEHAAWFARERRLVDLATLLASAFILALTIVGLFFRGPDWRLVLPL
jgi:hypothetical protein